MLVQFFLVLIRFAVGSVLPIGLVYSSKTDSSFLSALISNLVGLQLEIKNTLELSFSLDVKLESIDCSLAESSSPYQVPSSFSDAGIVVIIDAANCLEYSEFLEYVSVSAGFVHIVIQRSYDALKGEILNPYTFFLETNYITQAYAFLDIIKLYGWKNLGLIYDNAPESMNFANSFKSINQNSGATINDEIIVNLDEPNVESFFVSRFQSSTLNAGARILLVCTNPSISAQVLRAADLSVMGGSGYAYIFCSSAMTDLGDISKNSYVDTDEATFGVLKSGAIGFQALDDQLYDIKPMALIRSILILVSQGYQSQGFPGVSISASILATYLSSSPTISDSKYQISLDSNRMKISLYNIYNIQNFKEYLIGSWSYSSRKISLTSSSIVWPGFSSTTPNDQIPLIKLGFLYPGHDTSGSTFTIGTTIKNGFELGVATVNKEKIMGDYQFSVNYVDTNMLTTLAASNVQSLTSYSVIAFVGPYNTDETAAYEAAILTASDPKPLISYGCASGNFSSKSSYPNFFRSIQAYDLEGTAVAVLLSQIKWKKICVIYTLDDYGSQMYKSLVKNALSLGIEIRNKESKRGIRYSGAGSTITQKTKDDVDDALSAVVRKQCKVIVYLGDYGLTPYVAKTAHEKELYGSDYAWIGARWINSDLTALVTKSYSGSSSKIWDVLEGAVGLDYRTIIGTEGTAFAANYTAAYPSSAYTVYSIYAYDIAFFLANAISSIVAVGDNFNSGTDLIRTLRAADFTGASGIFKVITETNDRFGIGYYVVNVQKGVIKNVQIYDPSTSAGFISIDDNTILYHDGSASPTDDTWSTYYDCPFAEKMVSVDNAGVGIVVMIGGFLFIVTLILSYFAYKKWKLLEIQEINEPVLQSWKDTLVFITIAIEFCQFVAIAPTFPALESVVQGFSNVFMIDALKVSHSNKQGFWAMLSCVCALCIIWFLIIISIMSNAEQYIQNSVLCQRIYELMNNLYLPFIGNTMFLPFMTILLDVFVCDHKAQKKAFVWRDCYMNCWGSEHSPYIIISVIAMMCYEPLAAFSRPLWQQAKTGMNIMITPFFLLFKTCAQILLIAIGKSLQGTSVIAHGVVFSILFIAFTIVTYKMKPFNYGRCNLWEMTSLIAVCYISVLATLANAGDSKHIAWFVTLAAGWAIMVIVAVFIQKRHFPNYLTSTGSRGKRKIYDAIIVRKGSQLDSVDLDNSNVVEDQQAPTPMGASQINI
ncbi:unnamed protein product [Blepharisma stoltei]|uniref:Receptor ligand binding region domain-containing protein n=1 Tax=Blepharisma stoltei TaxID=1481888 RepID=A0AAU9JKT7_9CILI|nr:unnamed protein product [Blepharisma stoltei]